MWNWNHPLWKHNHHWLRIINWTNVELKLCFVFRASWDFIFINWTNVELKHEDKAKLDELGFFY